MLVYGLKIKRENIKQAESSAATSATATVPVELSTWEDPAEFQFRYPKDITLDPHDEDKENYAHVELKSRDHQGGILVWVKDAPGDIEKYLTKTKFQNLIDTTLDGEDAKKAIASDNPSQVTIALLKNGYLYQIEADMEDREYWGNVLSTVVETFHFVQPTKAPEDTSSGNEDSGITQDQGTSDEEVIE